MDVNNIYLLENKNMPWGDWGDILWSGITSRNLINNRICIERTGPFSPLLYLSNNDLVFTNEAKFLYDNSSLLGINFLYEIEKKRIVKLNWQNWDEKKHITAYLDIDGEPEDIVLRGRNDNELMGNMPAYWLAGIDSSIHLFIDKKSRNNNPSDCVFVVDEISHSDFFVGVERPGIYITQKAKCWIDFNFPDHFAYYLISRK